MFQFFQITHFRLKFPKGMYVYRNIMEWFSQIPKGFYVIVDIFGMFHFAWKVVYTSNALIFFFMVLNSW